MSTAPVVLRGPRRIVCLTGETTETLYRIGEQGRIVADPGEVIRRAPGLILESWCGKRFCSQRVAAVANSAP